MHRDQGFFLNSRPTNTLHSFVYHVGLSKSIAQNKIVTILHYARRFVKNTKACNRVGFYSCHSKCVAQKSERSRKKFYKGVSVYDIYIIINHVIKEIMLQFEFRYKVACEVSVFSNSTAKKTRFIKWDTFTMISSTQAITLGKQKVHITINCICLG